MTDPPEKVPADASVTGRIDAVCDAFEDAWKSNPPAQIEFYLEAWEEPERTELFRELVRIDLEFRRGLANETFSMTDYYKRFPEYQAEVDTAVHEASDITRGSKGPSRIPRPSPPIDLKPGDSIGDFDLIRQLGTGAFAVVFLAYQRSMMRRVALKISRRGRDEPPTLGQLDHPNIIRVFGVTRVEEQQLQLMYMEYLSGGTLQDVVAAIERGGAPPKTGLWFFEAIDASASLDEQDVPAKRDEDAPWDFVVCKLGAQVADALGHAHSKGILHRDIKPANILLTPTGSPRLADFNIAFGDHISEATAAGYFGGTLAYMSPEQLEACDPNGLTTPEDVDHRSDIYALAIVLWELLAGRIPFNDGVRDLLASEPAKKRREGLTDEAIESFPATEFIGIRDVLCRCLEPDPDDRYQAASEVARELRLCTNPRIQALMRPPRSATLSLVYRHPLLTTIVVSLIPNLLLSIANVLYDWHAIVRPLHAEEQFLPVMLWGKVALYFGGIVYGIWNVVHIFLAMREGSSAASVKGARYGCLALGDLVFGITLATWVASGLLFPLWTDLSGAELDVSHYLIFFTSHLLCGLISGNLVVFTLAHTAVRAFYPRLLTGELESRPLQNAHHRLQHRLEIYYMISIAVPFVSALALGLTLGDTGTKYWPAFLVLGVVGTLVWILGAAAKSETKKNLNALDEFVELSSQANL